MHQTGGTGHRAFNVARQGFCPSHRTSKYSLKLTQAQAEISIDAQGDYYEANQKLSKAQITLNDCLACR